MEICTTELLFADFAQNSPGSPIKYFDPCPNADLYPILRMDECQVSSKHALILATSFEKLTYFRPSL